MAASNHAFSLRVKELSAPGLNLGMIFFFA